MNSLQMREVPNGCITIDAQPCRHYSQQTKPPIKVGASEISSKSLYGSRLGARDKTADIIVSFSHLEVQKR